MTPDERDFPTYPMPENGWVCFHCGETFKKYGDAFDHFGPTPASITECLLENGALIVALRKAEAAEQEAREQEREACAAICDFQGDSHSARSIRARSSD